MDSKSINQTLQDIFRRLLTHYGPQQWWPARDTFEMMVGAILTQSAAWSNVEKAITNLKTAGVLSPKLLRKLSQAEIASLIHPSGYYNAKARKLKSFVQWLDKYYNDDFSQLFASDIDHIRQQLLSVYGIGPETADSIILYAANKPIFVIDTYTRRIISRIGLAPGNAGYAEYQAFFMTNLPTDTRLFNEYHALLVCLAKNICRPRPLCPQCCLSDICGFYSQSYK